MLTDITKFLDIEAKVDEGSEDDAFESEGDYGVFFDPTSNSIMFIYHAHIEFVVEDNEDNKSQCGLYRWDVLDDWQEDNSPEFLHEIARDIQHRHLAASEVEHISAHGLDDNLASRLPMEEDVTWRVRVKVKVVLCIFACAYRFFRRVASGTLY
jgi:hypothetical protein